MDQKEFEKRIRDADTVILKLLKENKVIMLSEQEKIKFVEFYRKQANLSLITADILYNISTEKLAKNYHKLNENYECFLWVLNASYYSMFYAVHSLLAYKGKRIVEKQGIHQLTAHAFVYFFIKNNFIAKELFEQFIESQNTAVELLNIDDFRKKAIDLTSKYFYETEKRSKFTYETNEEIKQKHANTSLLRAKEFLGEIEKIIEK